MKHNTLGQRLRTGTSQKFEEYRKQKKDLQETLENKIKQALDKLTENPGLALERVAAEFDIRACLLWRRRHRSPSVMDAKAGLKRQREDEINEALDEMSVDPNLTVATVAKKCHVDFDVTDRRYEKIQTRTDGSRRGEQKKK